MSSNCRFCDLQKEQHLIIKETALSVVILSNPRLMFGHTLVLPKRHIEKPDELTADELQDIFKNILFAESKLLAGGATGCDIRQNYRPFLPESRVKVDHVHFHVLPRTLDDELYQKSMRYETELFLDLSEEEQARAKELF